MELYVSNGINGPFYTADSSSMLTETIHPKGAAIGLNGNCDKADFDYATSLDAHVPLLVTEIYPGWLVHWGENDWNPVDISYYIEEYMK